MNPEGGLHDMDKKILLISFEFPPKIGGAGSVAFEYAKYLSDLGYKVTVVARSDVSRGQFDGFRVISVSSPPKVHLWYVFIAFLTEYKKVKYDKIILNDAGASMVASLFFKKKYRRKSIVFIHGSEDKKLINNSSILFSLLSMKARYFALLRDCSNIVSVSNHLKEKFIRITGLRTIEDKINVIRNRVNLPKLNIGDVVSLKKQLGIPQGVSVLMSASRLIKGKGYDQMLNIFARVIQAESKFIWLIAGDGDYRSDLEKKVEEMGLTAHILFLGGIEKAKLVEYYSIADVFWLLSNFDEGYGLVYVEAALNGCPVIGYNRGGVREAVSAETGFLVDTEEEALQILEERKFKMYRKDNVRRSAEIINIDMRHLIIDLI